MARDTISLTTGTTVKELKLARDSNGACMFRSYEVNNEGGHPDQPLFSQTDWHGGMGEGNFRDPTRFSTGSAIDASQPGQVFLGPMLTSALAHGGTAIYPKYYAYFGSAWYCQTTSQGVYKWSTGDAHWDNVWAGTGTGSGLCVFGSYMFAACGTAQPYYYTSDGANYTACTLTDHHATGFLVAPSPTATTDILWKALTPNELSWNASGINAGTEWATAAYIGDSSSNITKLMLHQDKLFVGKANGLYHYDSDGKIYHLLSVEKTPYTSNFLWTASFKGGTYFSSGGKIGEITANNVFDYIQPATRYEDLGRKSALCNGLAADDNALYASFDSGTTCEIFKGWQVGDSEGTHWAWTPWATFACTGGGGSWLQISPSLASGHPRLWITDQDVGCKYIKLVEDPTASTFYYTDTPLFATSGYLETGWIDVGHRDWDKVIDSVLAECRGTLAAGRTVTISYYADEGSIVSIGTYSADTAGTKKYIPTTPIAAKKIKFRIALASDNSAYTPKVKYFAAYGAVRPTRVRMFEFTVYGESGQTGLSEDIRDFLVTCRDATTLVTLVDRFGMSHYIRILPGYPIETELSNLEYRQTGIVMKILAQKLDWTYAETPAGR